MAYDTYRGQTLPSAGPEVAQREAEIPLAVTRLERSLDVLHETLQSLTMRLQPVMRAEPPANLAEKIGFAPLSTPVAVKISQLSNGVQEAEQLVVAILGRLEV